MRWVFETWARMFGRPSMYRLNRLLIQLGLRGIGVLNWTDERLSGEIPLARKLLETAGEEPVVVDVGAFEGVFSRAVLDCRPDARVIAIEPHPGTFERLVSTSGTLGVECHNVAAADSEGTAFLFDYPDGGGSSHASMEPRTMQEIHGSEQESVRVNTIRLGPFLATLEATEVFLAKIDVEGSELQVLRGLFSDQGPLVRVRHLIVEFNEMHVLTRTFLRDVRSILSGYAVSRILPDGRLLLISDERPVLSEIFAYQNLLFSLPGSEGGD